MRIAVSYDYGQVAPRFSAEQRFKVYDVCNNCVGHQSVVSTIGDNDTAARALSTLGVDTVICGSIRDNAKNALDNAGIKLCSGITGSADAAVKSFLTGSIHADHARGDRDCTCGRDDRSHRSEGWCG